MLGPVGTHPSIEEENQSWSEIEVEEVGCVTVGMSWALLITVESPEAQPGVPYSTHPYSPFLVCSFLSHPNPSLVHSI